MNKTVIAAIDNSAAAGPVLDAALSIAGLFGADVQAVHVREDGATTARSLARAAGAPFQLLDGPPAPALIRALRDSRVLLGVLGIRRTTTGHHPIGHIALDVVQHSTKPVIAVPPETGTRKDRPLRRVLVPLDGTTAAARAVEGTVQQLRECGVQVLALHVLDTERIPRFSDQPQHEMEVWEREFLARYCSQPGTRLHVRRGWASSAILELAAVEQADLITLGWAQDLSAGKAAVVREVLGRSTVPVMLLPLVVSPGRAQSSGPPV
ncbi:MAG TPA: universal stress protein [Candidatus Limnocylindrales bacterium]|nr:universal stress protein [Candidatus Limnocylindrales bacterium]